MDIRRAGSPALCRGFYGGARVRAGQRANMDMIRGIGTRALKWGIDTIPSSVLASRVVTVAGLLYLA